MADSTTNRPPLWQAMDNGMDAQANKEVGQTDPLVWRRIRAAEIRALRDWLGHCAPISWEARVVICRVLTSEADRAERGDG